MSGRCRRILVAWHSLRDEQLVAENDDLKVLGSTCPAAKACDNADEEPIREAHVIEPVAKQQADRGCPTISASERRVDSHGRPFGDLAAATRQRVRYLSSGNSAVCNYSALCTAEFVDRCRVGEVDVCSVG